MRPCRCLPKSEAHFISKSLAEEAITNASMSSVHQLLKIERFKAYLEKKYPGRSLAEMKLRCRDVLRNRVK